MNVLLVSTYKVACGIATYAENLARALAPHAKVFIAAESLSKDLVHRTENVDNVQVYRLWKRSAPFDSQFGLSAILNFIKTSGKPDAVHIQHEFGLFPDNAGFWKFVDALETLKIKVVITFHTVSFSNVGFFRTRNISVIAHTKEGCLVLGQYLPNKYLILHPVSRVPKGPEKPLDHGFLHWLVPGFISPSKNVEEIIKAFGESWNTCSKLHIVGLCRDPNYLAKLKSQITSYSLEEFINIDEGFKSDDEINAYLRTVDGIILGGLKTSPYSASGQLAQALGAARLVLAKNIPIYKSQFSQNIIHFNSAEELAKLLRCFPGIKQNNLEGVEHSNYITWPDAALRHLEIYRQP